MVDKKYSDVVFRWHPGGYILQAVHGSFKAGLCALSVIYIARPGAIYDRVSSRTAVSIPKGLSCPICHRELVRLYGL